MAPAKKSETFRSMADDGGVPWLFGLEWVSTWKCVCREVVECRVIAISRLVRMQLSSPSTRVSPERRMSGPRFGKQRRGIIKRKPTLAADDSDSEPEPDRQAPSSLAGGGQVDANAVRASSNRRLIFIYFEKYK
ncbi:hypothetical protein pipiens_018860 [Culex pipiens pipiens]|uniref:Uncharacterized protein n=1 Tax=Culex pipiens pipiens TaxID=38569 RepID=A0ABD1DXX2_CULPP